MAMRHQGKIAKWNDERGFGFISPSQGERDVYVHISSLSRSDRRPKVDEVVSYTLAVDSHGRPQANDVNFVAGSISDSPIRQIPPVPTTFAMSFLVALAALAVLGRLEMSWLALYYGASLVTYGLYAWDKLAAESDGRRIRESTLHLMSLVGGWPGALLAQVLLRHKSRKLEFLIGFWFTVIVNCIALGVIIVIGVSLEKLFHGTAG
jgi:uncharacterized membrane protein YsdA (DUF1294 family)/cold shock CspA family protein